MWKADLHIIDKIRKIESKYVYQFNRIMKYNDLFKDLKQILLSIKYDKKDANVLPCQVKFKFNFLDTDHLIIDWENYILNKERITIIIFYPPIIYYLIDSFSNTTLFYSNNIKDIYNYYNNLKNQIDYPVFIRNNYRLIDVLENPNSYINSCINRLIRKYNY